MEDNCINSSSKVDFNSSPKVGVKQPPVAFGEYSGAATKEPVALSAREAIVRRKEYLRQVVADRRGMDNNNVHTTNQHGVMSFRRELRQHGTPAEAALWKERGVTL